MVVPRGDEISLALEDRAVLELVFVLQWGRMGSVGWKERNMKL